MDDLTPDQAIDRQLWIERQTARQREVDRRLLEEEWLRLVLSGKRVVTTARTAEMARREFKTARKTAHDKAQTTA